MNPNDLAVVDNETGLQFVDNIIEVNVNEGSITCIKTQTVIDQDGSVATIPVKEPLYKGLVTEWRPKVYKLFKDFDVVNKNDGLVVAESRFDGVTT